MSSMHSELFNALPVTIISASLVKQSFEDSTHALWLIEADNYPLLFLKVVDNVDTPFWQIMQALFAVDLRVQLSEFGRVYQTISALTPIQIPALVACASQTSTFPAYLLTSKMRGDTAQASHVSDDMIVALASHLASLHKAKQATWGSMLGSGRRAADWSLFLRQTLLPYFSNDADVNGFNHQPSCFVPMMPDLRWDQFLMVDGRLSALVDLDAFVFAPIELDFVLLEYLMTAEQLDLWCFEYLSNDGIVPIIASVRNVYRKLLFAMQVLGETDSERWLARTCYFV